MLDSGYEASALAADRAGLPRPPLMYRRLSEDTARMSGATPGRNSSNPNASLNGGGAKSGANGGANGAIGPHTTKGGAEEADAAYAVADADNAEEAKRGEGGGGGGGAPLAVRAEALEENLPM